MTPVRHMQTCVPLPVPRAQASFVMKPFILEPWPDSLWWHVANSPGATRVGYSRWEILHQFGPRRPR